MNDLNDQLKPRPDQGQRLSLTQDQPPMDDAESQMRRALGLFGEGGRPRPDAERAESGQRPGGGFMQGVHRRRFVQDGEVPVTVVRRDSPDTGAPQPPTSSRLQRVEAALAAESAARDRAERALHEAQAALQALQTKIGHNELAKNEAVATSRHDREELVSLREELTAGAEHSRELQDRVEQAEDDLRLVRAELTEERRARKLAERLLSEATGDAPRVSGHFPVLPRHTPAPRDEVEHIPARRGRPPLIRPEPVEEAEPVKWWLTPTKTAAKRR